MITSFLVSLLLATTSPQQPDTLYVPQAQSVAPVVVQLPYVIDSLDVKRAKYDKKAFFEDNKSLMIKQKATTTIMRGAALGPHDVDAVCVVHFPLTVDRYMDVEVGTRTMRNFEVYLDGKKSASKFTLRPGQVDVALVSLSEAQRPDTFQVFVTSKSLSGLKLGPQPQPLSMSKMYGGPHYSNVSLSPSGKYLITVYYDQDEEAKNHYWTTITDVKSDKVLFRKSKCETLRWMPRRDVVYYVREWNKSKQLVCFSPESLSETVLADDLPSPRFVMSPDESFVVYYKEENPDDDKNAFKRLQHPDDRQPNWRQRSSMYLFDLKKGISRRLTYGHTSSYLSDISTDGKHLLLSYSRMELTRSPFRYSTIVEMDVATGRVDTLIADAPFLGEAKYALDGHNLVVSGSPNAFDNVGNEIGGAIANRYDMRLFLYDRTSRRATPLLRNFKPSVEDFEVSPVDGDVYFTATNGYGKTLHRLNVKTASRVEYKLPVSYVSRWSISSEDKSPLVCFTGFSGERARECYVGRLGSQPEVKLRKTGEVDFDEWYAGVAIGKCVDWNFRNSKGDTIVGFYYQPANFDATKKYPLIVYYYGGCTPVSKTLESHWPFAAMAAQGYIIYVLEPSGAIGFGQEFAARHVNTWGDGPAQDIIEGTKAFAAAHAFVDSTRIGCLGASYGGFMTQYLQTQTSLFKAAISHAGISNIASYWGGGYWGYTYGEVAQYGSYPWNNAQLYVNQSPLFHADKIHTPLLLLHGTVDTNVPPTESLQMYTALRILGRPVSHIQIDGENHIITEPGKRARWQEAMLAWFAYWLKGENEWWKALYPNDNFGLDADR